jgi:tetratricopeptide (TPR) repeat protein
MRLGLFIAALMFSSFTTFAQDCTALDTCQQILETRPKSSIAHYRIAEIHFARKEYQKAANTFRLALDGDLDPRWVKVWSYVSLGKVFDATGSRDRAVHFYRLAIATRDNTRGAVDEASKYLETPFAEK